MNRLIAAFALAVIAVTSPVAAQTAIKEAEIKAAVPYATMQLASPGITVEQYNRAVRDLAREQLGLAPLRPTLPAPSYETPPVYVPRAPRYTPPPVYVPTLPTYTPPKPTSGTTIDPLSGNSYSWSKNGDGSTHVNGANLYTGSMWNTTIQPSGSMNGLDKNFNPWTYDANSKFYMNLGTGKMCVGEGLARTCF